MISERPAFIEGEHFRINRKAPVWWRYTTLRTTRIKLDVQSTETISFRDRHGIEWMRLSPTICGKTLMTIREGYSWNGATCAPDLDLFLETLFHDIGLQFIKTQHFPFSKREWDAGFLDLMKLVRFKLKYIYWQAVRKFGWLFLGHNGEWSKVLTTHKLP